MNMIKKMVSPTPRDADVTSTDSLGGALTRLAQLFGVDGTTVFPEEPKIATLEPAVVAEPSPQPRVKAVFDGPTTTASLMSAFDVLHTPVLVVGDRLVVLHANKEALHVFSENIQGRSLAMFLRDPNTLVEIEGTLADGQARQINVNIDAPLKRQYRLNISRLASSPKTPLQVVLEFQETTLIRRTEAMRSEFVANVSHELRSPLATLIGFIETLIDGGESAKDRLRFLTIMDTEAQRMRRLINDLLSLANVELHEHERLGAQIDILGVLQEVTNALASRNRDVEICLICPDDLPAALGDRDQLIQVFQNLVTNAVKYGADGKRVDIIAETQNNGLADGGSCVEVRVCDYGPGIEAEHLPRLTERFYRVDKGRSRVVGGTGLGLAIVKHIVNRHRGRFHVESELGKGSVFKVCLPVYLDEAKCVATNL